MACGLECNHRPRSTLMAPTARDALLAPTITTRPAPRDPHITDPRTMVLRTTDLHTAGPHIMDPRTTDRLVLMDPIAHLDPITTSRSLSENWILKSA
ncbi:hypothetical protein MSG28_009684 [Choristoneura fumiferana]|uniref:Uncharacterized protein n=1 Tax=Choristoneura fumiferana TaxID=7141 RepID=A0ACC0JC41_CHOFU|nr:hypothetical protein MSG28_009684 [Choristoneura fumiferana]